MFVRTYYLTFWGIVFTHTKIILIFGPEKSVFYFSLHFVVENIGTGFGDPPFLFLYSSLLWDVFIINSVEQLQTLPKTQSEIDISPFLKQK